MTNQTNTPLRVLHVIGRMDMGGAETFIMNMFRNIDRSKIMFDFLVHEERECHYDKEIESLGGKIYRLPLFCGTNYFQYKNCCDDFFVHHPEYKVIHGHIGSSAAIYLQSAKKYGAYTIAHSHGMNYEKGIYHVAFAALSYPTRNIADAFFACSLDAGINRFGKKVSQSSYFHIVNNGIDLERFACTPQNREQAKLDFGVTGMPVFIHTGRFEEVKNHNFLIDVFSEIKKLLPNARLLLIGDGPLRSEVEQKCDSLNLAGSVTFFGVRNDVPQILKAADVFVFPSVSEGLPTVLVEAQTTGLPCISSTGIPQCACFLPTSKRLDLEDGAKVWATECVAAYQKLPNKDWQDGCVQVREAGFSAKDTAQWLQTYYESAYQVITTEHEK